MQNGKLSRENCAIGSQPENYSITLDHFAAIHNGLRLQIGYNHCLWFTLIQLESFRKFPGSDSYLDFTRA